MKVSDASEYQVLFNMYTGQYLNFLPQQPSIQPLTPLIDWIIGNV